MKAAVALVDAGRHDRDDRAGIARLHAHRTARETANTAGAAERAAIVIEDGADGDKRRGVPGEGGIVNICQNEMEVLIAFDCRIAVNRNLDVGAALSGRDGDRPGRIRIVTRGARRASVRQAPVKSHRSRCGAVERDQKPRIMKTACAFDDAGIMDAQCRQDRRGRAHARQTAGLAAHPRGAGKRATVVVENGDGRLHGRHIVNELSVGDRGEYDRKRLVALDRRIAINHDIDPGAFRSGRKRDRTGGAVKIAVGTGRRSILGVILKRDRRRRRAIQCDQDPGILETGISLDHSDVVNGDCR